MRNLQKFLAFTTFFITLALGTRADSLYDFALVPGKLPKTIIPMHYKLDLIPDLNTAVFSGHEAVDLEIQKTTKTIVLNSLNLDITQAKIIGVTIENAVIDYDLEKQLVTLTFPDSIKPGWYQLVLDYNGKLGKRAQGLYIDEYTQNHQKKQILSTMFEPTDARRMFPCWDEPSFKATFQLNLQVPNTFKAVSNMPAENEEAGEHDTKLVHFQTTPKMSTYLLAFAAGEFGSISGDINGVHVQVVAPLGEESQGEYALSFSLKVLEYYTDYFGIKYPLPQLSFIAMPGGFPGAMENWGAIIFNKSNLLFDPKTSSQATKEKIASFLSHEMAHLWFGDLVTMAWWNDLWLNEGFATWMSEKAVDRFYPNWNDPLRSSAATDFAMETDAQQNSHAIEHPISDESEAGQAFDEITYNKTAAVIQMLENYLGEKKFRDGIRKYMSLHKFSNAGAFDLWQSLEASSKEPVSKIMQGWIRQSGFPLVKVSASCLQGDQRISLTQSPFLYSESPIASNKSWSIPICLRDLKGGVHRSCFLLEKKTMKVPFTKQCGRVAIVDKRGYFRVQYDSATFHNFATLQHSLTDLDRVNLLNDVWGLIEKGNQSASDYFDLIQAFRQRTTLAMWEEVFRVLSLVDRIENGHSGQEKFHAYCRKLLSPLYQTLGWTPLLNEDENTGILRGRVIGALGKYGDKEVVDEAFRRFKAFEQSKESLSPNLRSAVLFIVGRYADLSTFEALHKLEQESQNLEEKLLLVSAMQSALDPKLAAKACELATSNELDPIHSVISLYTVAYQGGHPEIAWQFVQDHLKELLGQLPESFAEEFVPTLMSAFNDESRADELESFAREHLPSSARAEVEKGAEKIRLRAKLKKRLLPQIDRLVNLGK